MRHVSECDHASAHIARERVHGAPIGPIPGDDEPKVGEPFGELRECANGVWESLLWVEPIHPEEGPSSPDPREQL